MRDFNVNHNKEIKSIRKYKSKSKRKFHFGQYLFILTLFFFFILISTLAIAFLQSSPNIKNASEAKVLNKDSSTNSQIQNGENTPIPVKQALSNSQNMENLKTEIDSLIDKYSNIDNGLQKYEILIDDKSVSYKNNVDEQMTSASLYKLFILYKVECDISGGFLNNNSKITITSDVNSQSEDGESLGEVGSTLTVKILKEYMIENSSNTAALALGFYEGFDNIQNFLNKYGFNHTNIWPLPTTSASDIYKLLSGITNKNLGCELKDSEYEDMLNLLKNQQVNTNMSPGFPNQTIFAHKTGNVDDYIHDAGILFMPDGRKVIIVAMTKGNLGNDESFLTDLATTLWNNLS